MMPSLPVLETWVRPVTGVHTNLAIQRMPGATSSHLYRVKSAHDTWVLRAFDDSRWLEGVQDLAEREAAILKHLVTGSIPAPRLVEFDPDMALVLMTFKSGKVFLPSNPELAWLGELARQLHEIHEATVESVGGRYRSWRNSTSEVRPNWFDDAEVWQVIQQVLDRGAPPTPLRFIHRDYHPLNVLWKDGRISSVVDWDKCLLRSSVRRRCSLPGKPRVDV